MYDFSKWPVSHIKEWYEGVFKSFRTESTKKYMLTTINTR